MFARFDENPAMTLQDIKETKRYGRTDGRTDDTGRTDNVKTVYPPQTKFAGGIYQKKKSKFSYMSFYQKLFFLNKTPSCICSMCLYLMGKVSNCSIKSCGRS